MEPPKRTFVLMRSAGVITIIIMRPVYYLINPAFDCCGGAASVGSHVTVNLNNEQLVVQERGHQNTA